MHQPALTYAGGALRWPPQPPCGQVLGAGLADTLWAGKALLSTFLVFLSRVRTELLPALMLRTWLKPCVDCVNKFSVFPL